MRNAPSTEQHFVGAIESFDMDEYLDVLSKVELFASIDSKELEAMLKCLNAEIKDISKDNIILLAGDKPRYVGVVLAGRLHIVREDYDGNRVLVEAITPAEIFLEAMCCAGVSESPVSVIADTDSTIMTLSFQCILHTCSNACSYHARLIDNMVGLIAKKNILLQRRIEIASMKSVRSKVLRYLESFVPKQGYDITIPFNREELADFLSVDRSALSHELARMKKDGLIEYRKNRFILKKGEPSIC